MNPLYEDMGLSEAQKARVRAYLEEIDFHLPGATHEDFSIGDTAAYLGFMFLSEDLEAFAVPLTCTSGPHAGRRTFIRMSRDQLLGRPNALILPVNDPVQGSDVLVTNRWRAQSHDKTRHGIDSYAHEDGQVPGFDMDMRMLELTLNEVIAHDETGLGKEPNSYSDPSIYWGTLMAGRYPRLLHYKALGKLSDEQVLRLSHFEQTCHHVRDVFTRLDLCDPATIAQQVTTAARA